MLYSAFAKRFPTQPVPRWRIRSIIQRLLVRHISQTCEQKIFIKHHAYFGMSTGIKIGDRSQIGERSFIGAHTTIGKDVIMGPEIVIWSVSHRFDRVDIPINQQDGIEPKPVTISDDVWIGQRVMIMPCVQIGNHTVIGAGSIVTRDLPDRAVAAGILARIIRMRKLIIN